MQNQPSHRQTEWKLKKSMSHVLKIFWYSIAEWSIWTTTRKVTEEQKRKNEPRGYKDTSVSDMSAPGCVQVNHWSNTCRNEHFLSHKEKKFKKEKKLVLWGNLFSVINSARSNQFQYLVFQCPTDLNLFFPTSQEILWKKKQRYD